MEQIYLAFVDTPGFFEDLGVFLLMSMAKMKCDCIV